ncbi:hypothetical protein [Burkholderia diffusa]|uniref:hypothetical protein n=1 Tax=Burkholderia diffusa TaxID=488732 RepID=UPI00158C45DA|nr:hypothetical protein [Burkholderia diffusa]
MTNTKVRLNYLSGGYVSVSLQGGGAAINAVPPRSLVDQCAIAARLFRHMLFSADLNNQMTADNMVDNETAAVAVQHAFHADAPLVVAGSPV